MNISVESASPDFLENISVGQHGLQAHEPLSAGGQDAAPSAYELLLAALGACKVIMVREQARNRIKHGNYASCGLPVSPG
jgi:putative redox protein